MVLEDNARAPTPTPVSEPPGDETDSAPDDPIDPTLAEIARAEAEAAATRARYEAGDPTLPAEIVIARAALERRRRGHTIWGTLSLTLSTGACAWPIAQARGSLRQFTPDKLTTPTECTLIAVAIALGTLGCRRPAGRRTALAGRLLAWSAPPLLLLIAAAAGNDDGDFVIVLAGGLVWIAGGLFGFAVIDALVAP